MDGKKVYQIQINGITESANAVEALNKQLDALSARIKALEKSNVKVSAASSGGKGASSSAMDEEAKLAKQIEQIDEKRKAYSKEIYQNYLAAKDVLKETVKDQQQIAAQERLQAQNYGNTMAGMKQQLADIKLIRNYTDVASEDFDKLGKKALELTNALKKYEEETGQFGRNVGNYKSAADGFEKLKYNVAGTVREFETAKQAAKTLANELQTLQAKKDSGILLTEEETQRFKELPDIVANIKSAIADAGKPMDAIMDSMQSFVAIAQAGKGFTAFFGLDNDEVERSIQKLVALQNAMQGLQTIQKQMQSQEGIGKMFAKGNKSIDEFVAKVTKAKIGVDGLEKSTKLGTVTVNLFSKALKGIASLGIMAGITALITLLEEGIEWVKNWVNGDADLVSAEDALTASIEQQNKVLDDNVSLIQKRADAGEITKEQARVETEEAYAKALAETNKRLLEREDAYRKVGVVQPGKTDLYLGNAIGDTGVTSFGGFDEGIKGIDDFNKRWDLLSTAVANGTDALNKWNYTARDAKDDFVHMAKLVGGDLLNAFNKMADGTRDGTKALVDYISHMDELTSGRYSQAIKIGIDNGYLDEQFKMAWGQYEKLKNDIYKDPVMVRLEVEADAANFLKSLDPNGDLKERIAKWKKELEDNVNSGGKNLSVSAVDTLNKAIKEGEKKINSTLKKSSKSTKKTVVDVEKELIQLRIANMKEGLNKTITQLEEERKQKLAKIYADGRLVKERELELNKYYNKKIEDEYKEHAKNVEDTYRTMWNNIMSYNVETASKAGEYITSKLEYNRKNLEYKRSELSNPENSSYGVQGINQLTKETREELQLEKQNNKSLSTTYRQRLIQVKDYWAERIKMEKDAANKNYLAQVALENERFSAETRANKEHYEKVEEDLKNNIGVTINDVTEAQALLLSNLKAFQDRETILIYNHEQKIQNLYEEGVSTIQSVTAESYRDRLQELRDFQTAIANLEAKQPVFNNWGIINLSETEKNNENLLNAYRNLADDIVLIKKDLQEKLDNKQISFDEFQQANRELDTFADSVGQKMDKVKKDLSVGEQIGSFIQSINQYVQAELQAIQTVLNAVDEYNSAMIEKDQEALDKENEELEDKLKKQEDILNKHKDAVESIEDELATSRGDRRQHLIDQLNAEMEAERKAAAEKKILQKEQDALDKKQQDIDRKRKEAEYHRNINSIIVSNAMAVANGYATQPFIPVGLAMGSLALALGAVQLGLAKAAKPYAHGGQLDGGVAQGPRHSQGGIKVLGGRAEIEGGEFITNRRTTASNIALLEFINSKKTKVDLGDLLEFYNGNTIKKNIRSVRTKFEDGGYIPTLPNQLDIKEQLQNIVVNQDNRPIYVSVVDINNKQDQVRRVQTLAGL